MHRTGLIPFTSAPGARGQAGTARRTLAVTMSPALAAQPVTPSLPQDRPRRRQRMRNLLLAGGVLGFALSGGAALAQQPTVEELLRRIDALERQVEELARRPAPPVAATPVPAPPPTAAMPAPAPPPVSASPAAPPLAAYAERVPGLRPYEPMGASYEDALASDLPGIALRIPNTQTEVRLYGWAKLTAWGDFNGRNQTDAPPVQTIPLNNSSADQQGGDFGMTARFSRVGLDTRTLTNWGTLETRLEGDFGGGAPTSNNAVFRLRQAWAEVGSEAFRVLIGQTNSLWNEGLFETLIDATNLNQSFIRQAQLRLTGRLAPGLTGKVSLEAPDTQYTSAAGVFTPGSSLDGGASPAFNALPDLLGRLTYRNNGLELVGRAALRQLSLRTAGTAAAPPSSTQEATGWGFAGQVRFPMRWLAEAFGPDELIGMGYYGDGMGRYFAGNTSGQDALSNIGLPGTTAGFSFDPIPTYGLTAAYRRFWTPQLRSNFSYAYARQDYPSYARGFTPGSASATSLNREMQQVFVNLIWSPFGTVNNGVFSASWLDVGLEYLYSSRDLFGGAGQAGTAGDGDGIANRLLFGVIARF